jgi:hypothetical protein
VWLIDVSAEVESRLDHLERRLERAVTDHGWTARQPDGTPVGELPLRWATIYALRAGGVLTLGELRTMGDHELRRLRRFGSAALADVRSLVATPAGARR